MVGPRWESRKGTFSDRQNRGRQGKKGGQQRGKLLALMDGSGDGIGAWEVGPGIRPDLLFAVKKVKHSLCQRTEAECREAVSADGTLGCVSEK
jgi:hypothetical protein